MKRPAAGVALLAGLLTLPRAAACAERPGSGFAVSSVAVGRQPNDVTIGDVDGDGHPDV